ncbi:MAG: TIGR00269 family protein [Candidatus Heimdallarchaeota archaeon]|nr:TIGR00269 family protein [Candidatus Heimdallarchaeota archaeon]MDH5645555.1 TIGR00269 family protein [Candidatus Heimdallarchaeota archaeon]
MIIPKCSECDKTAAWHRPWDKTLLCVMHFNRYFIHRIQKTINKYQLFEREDTIAIGLSGGKDSVVLLDVMSKIQKKYKTKMIAISIDEGIENYRKDGLKFAKLAAQRANIEHKIYSFKDRFGHGLDDSLILLGSQRQAACSYCGPFRRKLLNEAARLVGADKLATGHNADDEAQTLLMNTLRGDILKTLHSNPIPVYKNDYFVNRVKPLRRTSEMEIVLYANFNDLPYQEQSCPHAVEAYRGKIREILTNYAQNDPSVVFSIIKSIDSLHNLASFIPKNTEHTRNKEIRSCMSCEEPSNQDYCASCRIINELKKVKDNL